MNAARSRCCCERHERLRWLERGRPGLPRAGRARRLLQPTDRMARRVRASRLVFGRRKRGVGVPPLVPTGAGPPTADLAGPGILDATPPPLPGGRPRRCRGGRARPGRVEVRRSGPRRAARGSSPTRPVIRSASCRRETEDPANPSELGGRDPVGAEDLRDLTAVVEVVLDQVPDDPRPGHDPNLAGATGPWELDLEVLGRPSAEWLLEQR